MKRVQVSPGPSRKSLVFKGLFGLPKIELTPFSLFCVEVDAEAGVVIKFYLIRGAGVVVNFTPLEKI